ncbi:MAG: hypothetical protein ACXABF_15415 [Candidatus Thorarchaeota archaeon]
MIPALSAIGGMEIAARPDAGTSDFVIVLTGFRSNCYGSHWMA